MCSAIIFCVRQYLIIWQEVKWYDEMHIKTEMLKLSLPVCFERCFFKWILWLKESPQWSHLKGLDVGYFFRLDAEVSGMFSLVMLGDCWVASWVWGFYKNIITCLPRWIKSSWLLLITKTKPPIIQQFGNGTLHSLNIVINIFIIASLSVWNVNGEQGSLDPPS